MRIHASWKILAILAIVVPGITGCSKTRPTKLMGRWYNKDISIRFRSNGSVLYNSRSTGLVEGRYQYEPKVASIAESKPKTNLTIWLPQPGRISMREFEMRFLGDNRIKMKPIVEDSQARQVDNLLASTALVLKRAPKDTQGSDTFDEQAPLVSATPSSPAPN